MRRETPCVRGNQFLTTVKIDNGVFWSHRKNYTPNIKYNETCTEM